MTHIQPAVLEKLNDPGDAQVRLLVGVSEELGSAIDQIEAKTDADIERQLPYKLVELTVLESELQTLCELDSVETVEVESQGHQMSGTGGETGNPNSHRASTQ